MALGFQFRSLLVVDNLVGTQDVVAVMKLLYPIKCCGVASPCLPIGLPLHRYSAAGDRFRLCDG
jgi:hypothetical protein